MSSSLREPRDAEEIRSWPGIRELKPEYLRVLEVDGRVGALHDRGLRRAELGVDTENVSGALRLYERVGKRVVRRYDNWEVEV